MSELSRRDQKVVKRGERPANKQQQQKQQQTRDSLGYGKTSVAEPRPVGLYPKQVLKNFKKLNKSQTKLFSNTFSFPLQ